jgi:hypothetical protein
VARTAITRERGREVQRLEKLLEDAGIKLSSVASDVMGVSGRLMLQALIEGQHDPAVLADLAKRRLRSKIPALTEALTGRFTGHHGFLARLMLAHIDQLATAIAALDDEVDREMAPFTAQRDRLDTIPGVSKRAAEVMIAEIGVDMTRFPTAGHLTSWAGMCPGNNESAGNTIPAGPARATRGCAASSARSRPVPVGARPPTSATATGASPPGGARNALSLRSGTPYSPRRGRCSAPTPTTSTSAPTITCAERETRPGARPSCLVSYRPSVSASAWNRSADPPFSTQVVRRHHGATTNRCGNPRTD